MKYQIGKVAKLLDISAQGLRLYEKEGIIFPERKESGYRTYKRLDITSLLRARTYQKYGFSLQEIKEMLNTDNLEYLYNKYENHEKVLEQLILKQQLELNRLRYTKELLDFYNMNPKYIGFEYRPTLYRFEYMYNDELLISEESYTLLNNLISLAPLSFSSIRNEWVDVLDDKDIYYSGIAIKKDDADLLQCKDLFSNDNYLDSVYCLTTFIKVDDNHSFLDCLSRIKEYINDNSLEVIGDIISESIVSYNKKDNYTRIRKIWIPIKE